jgi:hypothetical protein
LLTRLFEIEEFRLFLNSCNNSAPLV